MAEKHGVTTERVYEYFRDNPGASLEEAAEKLNLPSRSNVRYHILKLAAAGRVVIPDGKHRMIRVVEEQE